jgi:hypothetical protein
MQSPRSGSAAHIVVRPRSHDNDPLRCLLDDCGPNKNDRAIVLITACISDGVNTGREIIARGVSLGLDPAHVALILSKDAGSNPDRHRWQRGGDGVYYLHSVKLAA